MSGTKVAEILEAASRLAALLTEVQGHLVRTRMFRMPEALGRFVTQDLQMLRLSAG
jgi:hypothetical protein